jgi:hypothetical protein
MLKAITGHVDMSDVNYDDHSPESWVALMKATTSGQVVKIDQSIYEYFFEVLPPRKILGRGDFVFCEGDDFPHLFCAIYGEWACVLATSDQPVPLCYGDDMTAAWKPENLRNMRLAVERALGAMAAPA